MPHLTFTRVSNNGETLYLADSQGNEFTITVTEGMRAALAPKKSRSQLQMRIPVDGPLTLKDVQRRLRHGASLDEVVAESGLPLEKVESFAVPILQERAYVAEQAQACILASGDTLREAVTEKLRSRGVLNDPDWDSWRRHDALWTVVARIPADQSTVSMSDDAAEFTFDPTSRTVIPENDAARWLSNAPEPAVPAAPEPQSESVVVIEDEAVSGMTEEQAIARHPAGSGRPEPAGTPVEVSNVSPLPRDGAPAAAGGGKPLSRRAARRRSSRQRADQRREPTWDEILFGVSRHDPKDE
ncbi:MAG: DUF3071 domain-containing protein [Actinobacteria bacterium]|nr:MAG: DUF3071 domain-containing protein [Actinomycetota bacterium]